MIELGGLRAVRGTAVGLVASLAMSASPTSAAPGSSVAPPVEVEASVVGSTLLATGKPADFGLGDDQGIRWVELRIVDELVVTLRLAAATDVPLATPPRLCLVGPLANPIDAGLSDRCWGEPDLRALVAAHLTRDDAGQLVLPANRPLDLTATLRRGSTRCDYPPGAWHLEVGFDIVGDGAPGSQVDLPDVRLDVPVDARDPLHYLPSLDTRFCSYAATIFLEQGPPAVVATPMPRPS